ncbi:hypothetical protein [Streptomyces sp. NPDC101132]|uniref:hypothetical protein n=1 Tax=Streptomyces sp. NPDC101132 TaxID=3366110 RepID=UPI003815ADCB
MPPERVRARAAEVRAAYEGLRQIRRLVNAAGDGRPGDPTERPAPWERERPLRAVSLALEAAGVPASAVDGAGRRTETGYVVRDGEEPGTVRVSWLGPPGGRAAEEEAARLAECRSVLERAGWDALLYRGARHRRYVEVAAPR